MIGGCGLIAVSPPTGAASRITCGCIMRIDSACSAKLCGAVSENDVVVVRATVRHDGSSRRQIGTSDFTAVGFCVGATSGWTVIVAICAGALCRFGAGAGITG